MAVTNINGTRNGTGAVSYVLRPKEKGRERVRSISGNNVNIERASEQMRITREAYGKNGINSRNGKEFVQAYRLKQSFSDKELDPNSDEDVATCNRMGLELAKEVYPDHEVLVVTHSDGLGGKLHNHLIINAVSFETGKSLRAELTNWNYVSQKSDEILKRNGLSVIDNKKGQDKKTQAEVELAERGEYVWKEDLKERIRTTLSNDEIIDRDRFIEHMKEEHEVDVRFRGKGMSYAFEDEDGKKRRIRSSRMGTNFQKENIEELIEENKKIVDLEPVAPPTKSHKPSFFDSVMSDFVNANVDEIRAEKEEKQRQQEERQKAENERIRAERVEREEKARQELEKQRRADLERKREKDKRQQQERLKQQQIERERLEQEQKREFMENVQYVKPKLGGKMNVVGYRNQVTNEDLTPQEVAWYREYREEKRQQRTQQVITQQIMDELER